MQKLKWILQLSRPRFWFYLIGPVLLAIASTVGVFIVGKTKGSYTYDLAIIVLFFTLPANLLIYGLNDLFDYETDKHNEKKKSYETILEPKNRRMFLRVSAIVVGVAIVPLLFILFSEYSYSVFTHRYELYWSPNWPAIWSLIGFVFFGIFYSIPPIRAKVHPFFDSFFNILYVFPGILAYAVITNSFPPVSIIIAATLWCMAMHAYSAIPDISSDKKAHIDTIATRLGRNGTLLFCSIAYLLSASFAYEALGWFAVAGSTIYLALMILSYKSITKEELFSLYKVFPFVNVLFGFLLFWYILIPRL